MSDADDNLQEQLRLLHKHRRSLAVAFKQMAAVGGFPYASLGLLNSIDEAYASIQLLKGDLRAAGVVVEDDTNDTLAQRLRLLTGNDGPRAGDTPLGTRVIMGRFNSGMSVLRELMQRVPEIHDAAIEFRTLFQGACKQIDTLRSYKALHDQLHALQFRCYEHIEQELQYFPEREQSLENLQQYAENLHDCIDELREIIADAPGLKPAPIWIDWLAEAHTQMLKALAAEDAALLRRAADQIRRVLNVYPSPINARLISTVQGMDLGALVYIMQGIHHSCEEANVEAGLLERIAKGLDALRSLHEHLTGLSNDHEQWQPIDNLLRLPNASIDDIISLWDTLKAQASELYATSAEQWALDLRADEARIDQAMQHNDPRALAQQFVSYRSRAMRRFFYVDKQLKKLCDKLDHVSGPFAFVIGVLE